MRHWIFWLGLLCSLTACQLTAGSSSSDVMTSQPTAARPTQTAVLTIQPRATGVPTATPPKINTPAPVILPTCQRRTDWPTYLVVAGDTLGKIANRSASDVATLSTANCLSNADQISVGQILYVPRVPTVPTLPPPPPADNGFVVSALPANGGCYLQIYGMMGSAVVQPTPDNTTTALGTVTMQFLYRIYSQTPTYYEIAYNTQGQTGWVEKTGGSSVGDCRVLTQVPVHPVTMVQSGLAFDYPSNWYSTTNIDGLPGGYVGSIRLSDIPPAPAPWTNDMVMVSYTLMPDGIVPSDLETAARQEIENWRKTESYTIVQEVTPFTSGTGLNGFVFEYKGPLTEARVYYLHINNRTVVFSVNGNHSIGEYVVNTARAG